MVLRDALAALVFALSCNVDTLVFSMGAALRGRQIRTGQGLLLAGLTTLVTDLSLRLGEAALLWSGAERLGKLALVALGAYTLLEGLKELQGEGAGEAPCEAEAGPSWAWLYLSAALALNNAGAGLCAGVSGLHIPLADGCTFLVTLLALALGRRLSRVEERWRGWAVPLSGLLLILLGLVG